MMKAWEAKATKRAANATGFTLMAVALAACNDDGVAPVIDTADLPAVDLTGSGTTSVHMIQRTEGEAKLLWDGQFANTTFGDITISELFDNNAVTAEYIAPILTTQVANDGVVFGRTTSAADDQIYADGFAMHNAVIDGGLGTDTVIVNMKSPFAQPLAVVNVENMEVVNVDNIYVADTGMIAALEDPNSPYIATSFDSAIDLAKVVGLQSLTLSEGSNAGGHLAVWNVSTGTALTFAGNFAYDVDVDYKGALERLDITFDNVSVDSVSDITVSHNAKTVDLTSTGGGTNDIDGSVFGTQMRVLNVEGNTDLDTTAIAFDDNRAATINIGAMTGDTNIEVAAKNAVNYTSGATMTGAEKLTLTGDDLSGEERLALDVDMGAGSNTLLIKALASPTYVSGSIDGSANTVSLEIDGTDIVDATRVADVTSIGKVTFYDNAAQLHLNAAQVDEIGIANFDTADFVNADGQLVITNVTSTTALDLSLMGSNGELISVQTADASDVTLSSGTVLGNLQDGVGKIQILAESGDASLTLSAAQFTQLASTGTIEVVGIGVAAAAGNNPADNTPFEGTATITGVGADTVLVLSATSVVIPANRLSELTIEVGGVTATSKFSITDGNAANFDTVLEISGTTDLSKATLTGVNAIKLVDGADVTLTAAQIATFDISGTGNINVDADLTLNSTNNDLDLSAITITFTKEGAAELTIAGAKDVTLKGVKTTDDVTALTIDNDLTTNATLDITGGSPALDLDAATTGLTIQSEDSSFLKLGTDPDEPGIVAPGLTSMTVTNAVNAQVNLGTIDSIAGTFALTVTNGTKTTVELVGAPANSNWTISGGGAAVSIGDNVAFGAGTNLELTNVVLKSESDVSGVLAPTSTLTIDSSYSVADINALLDAAGTGGITAVGTGMSAAQLNALAAKAGKVAAINGSLAITKDVTAENIGVVYDKLPLGVAGTSSVNAADMSVAQLKAVAVAHAQVSAAGITNLAVNDELTDGEIGNLLAKAFNASVDADDMSSDQKAAVAANAAINNVSAITNLKLDETDVAANIAKLLTKATAVTVDADGMDKAGNGAQKAALAADIGSIASITDLTLADADNINTMSTLLTKSVDASVDATSMLAEKLTFVADNIAKVKADGISNLALTKDQSAAEITTLLGKAGAATDVALTDLSAAQVTSVVGGVAKVDTVSGETTAAVLKQLDTAYGPTLDADPVTDISGSAAELKEVVIDAQAAGVNTIKLAADVALTVTNAAGTSLTAVQLNALQAKSTAVVTVPNAVTITGLRADVTAALVTAPAVVAATALVTITDAAATALNAADLSDIGDKTTGTVTVSNAVKITGSQAQVEAAVITPETKVVAATANLEVTGVTTMDGASAHAAIAAIAATTSGTTTLVGTNDANTFNFTGYTGGDLIIDGGAGADVITVTQGAHTLTGGADADTFNISGGTQTITDLGAGGSADVVKLTGGTLAATVTGNWTATSATVNQAASNASFVINVSDAHTVNVSASSAGATDKGFTIKSTGTGAITGSGKADILENTSGSATFTGGSGNDTFIAKADTMTIAAGDLATGDILIAEGTGSITASGISTFVATTATSVTGTGSVFLFAAATAGSTISVANAVSDKGFILIGGDGVDTITGSAKADVIFASAGDDVVVGGAGDDTFKFTDAQIEANSGTSATFNGGDGTNVVEITIATDGLVDADLQGFTNMDVLKFSSGDNTLTAGDNFNAAFGAIDITGAIDLAFTQGTAADIGSALAPLQIIGYTVDSAETGFDFLGTDAASDAALTDFTVGAGLYTDTDGTVADFFTKAEENFAEGDVGMFHHSGNTYVFAEGSDDGAADDVYLEIVDVLLTSVSETHGALVLHII